jgi:hypothetical protein
MSSSQISSRPCLLVRHGPAELGRITLAKDKVSIGRRDGNDLVLEDLTVSGEHAVLHNRAGVTVIADLGSRNGTQVNGMSVTQQVLHDGDCIDIGVYSLRYVAEPIQALPFESPLPAHLMVLTGSRAGQSLPLDRARVSVQGDAGQLAIIAYRRHSHWLTHLDGSGCPLINGEPIGLTTRELDFDDLIEIGGTLFQFCFGPAA